MLNPSKPSLIFGLFKYFKSVYLCNYQTFTNLTTPLFSEIYSLFTHILAAQKLLTKKKYHLNFAPSKLRSRVLKNHFTIKLGQF